MNVKARSGQVSPLMQDGVLLSLDTLEAATRLLKSAKASDLAYYYLGTLPFLWLLIRFWAEMTKSANAERHLWSEAWMLVVAYVAMKVGQTLFVQRLLLLLREDSRRWTVREILRMARRTAIVQTSALAVTSFALCLVIPTAWTFAFYHHAQATCEPDQKDVLSSVRAALRGSQLWPRQNHGLLTLHAAFGFVAFLNVWALLVVIPHLLHSLMGVETRLLAVAEFPFNTTLLATALAIAVALTDPWLKAAYAVRAFRAQSIASGRDLIIAWKQCKKTAVTAALLTFALCLIPLHVRADPVTVSKNPSELPASAEGPGNDSENSEPNSARLPSTGQSQSTAPNAQAQPPLGHEAEQLDQQLTRVLMRPAFDWRMAAPHVKSADAPTWFDRWILDGLKSAGKACRSAFTWVAKIINWLLGLGGPSVGPVAEESSSWEKFADRGTVVLALVAVLVPLGLLLRRRWRARPPLPPKTVAIVAQEVSNNEGMEAARLPEDEWQKRAQQFFQAGEKRQALRALFLGNLARLIHAGHLVAAAHKSVGDYRRDLNRRSHAYPNVYQGYVETAAIFESVWYGSHEVTDASLQRFTIASTLLRQDV